MVKQILCNEFRLEVGKLHLVSKTGSVVTLCDLDHNVLQVAIDHMVEHLGDLIQGGNLDEVDMKDVEKESFSAQWLKDVVSL